MDNFIIDIIKEKVSGEEIVITGSYLYSDNPRDVDVVVFGSEDKLGHTRLEVDGVWLHIIYHKKNSLEQVFGTKDNRIGWSRHNLVMPVYNVKTGEYWEGDPDDIKFRKEQKARLRKIKDRK